MGKSPMERLKTRVSRSRELSETIEALQEPGFGMGMDWKPRNAATKLGQLGGSRAVKALTDAVETHPNEYVRTEAAQALATIGNPTALGVLERAATSDSSVSNVRPTAARAAGQIRDKAAR